ncbi:hypothetical protein HPP92_028757 [Vanilla planifolia]|uniref:Uncharacterized protein n=1 Tax=Vanilla planifolia TaxID=51239 RepID=A0A835U227_VANPL|nr:hypothetical protein HPP92_028757 [Vanilla planifolia]
MVLATLRHSWRKVSVINIVILIVLVVVYAFACGFRNNKWMDNGEAYGQAKMTKSRPSSGVTLSSQCLMEYWTTRKL